MKKLSDLPDELLLMIANMLESPKDILAFLLANKQMYNLNKNSWLWCKYIEQHLGTDALNDFRSQASDGRDEA